MNLRSIYMVHNNYQKKNMLLDVNPVSMMYENDRIKQ